MPYLLNVDADELLYSAAFAAEKSAYRIKTTKGEYDVKDRYSKRDLIELLGRKNKVLDRDYTLEAYKIVSPVSHALSVLKRMIAKLENIGEVALWLTSSDKSNFRFKIAKTKGPYGVGYKEGRPAKPQLYNECREYLIKRGAKEVSRIEADDILGIMQTEDTVAVHIDKDINRIAGKHYNWRTGKRYVVEQPGVLWLDEKRILRGYGNAFFFSQMLLGDRVDNIPSLGRFGDVEVYNILSKCKTEIEYWEVINSCFHNYYGKDYKETMYEIADLAYIIGPERLTGRQYIKLIGGE